MAKIPKWSRIPTPSELAAFTGMHCSRKYKDAVESGWRCPACGRSAQELVRWTEIRGATWREQFGDDFGMGFTVVLTEHHCHGHGRFTPTLICGDCNSADGAAKRKLGLPESWTYSPAEIAKFVSVTAHSGRTTIDYVEAQAIYERALATERFRKS